MLEQPPPRGSDIDIAYMPYHEGLVNHNAPPVRGSLSVRVSAGSSSSNNQLLSKSSSFFANSDDDDDVSDDPPWMNAPRGSLQPAMPSSLLKKASSGYSVTDMRSTSPVSPGTEPSSAEEEEDQQTIRSKKTKKQQPRPSRRSTGADEEDSDDYFPPQMPMAVVPSPPTSTPSRQQRSRSPPSSGGRGSTSSSGRGSITSSNGDGGRLSTDVSLRKSKTMPMDQGANPTPTAPVVNLGAQRNSRGNSEIKRLSFELKQSPCLSSPTKRQTSPERESAPSGSQSRGSMYNSRPVTPAAAAIAGTSNGFRDSMMRYRPSDLKPQELTLAMLSRDSLAPDTHGSNDMYASSRSSNILGSSRSNDPFGSSRSNDPFGSSRSNDPFGSSRSNDPFGSSRSNDPFGSSRGSVMQFGPRVTEEGLSEYLRAVKAGNLQLLRACLQDRNTDLTERDPVHGQSAMHIAVRFGQLHAVQLLCGKKTRSLLIDAVDNRQNTPLHLASAKSRRLTKYLLEQGADASRVNSRNQTPLAVHIITAKRDEPLISEMLLQHKTDPNGQLGNSTLLHKAVDLKFYEIAYRLVRHGARLDIKDAHGRMVFEKVDRKVLRQLCSKIAFPPVWVPNTDRKSCMGCLRNFSRLGVGVRRHHCRHCGRIVCGRCSHVSVESEAFPESFIGHIDRNPSDERSTLKRVCKTCSSVLDERAKAAKAQSPDSRRKWSDAFMDRVVNCSWDEIDRHHSNSNASRRSSVV